MNRETKRTTQRQGQLQEMDEEVPVDDPAPVAAARASANGATARQRKGATHRNTPMQFLREVRDELRQVAWPSRVEMINYSTVVLATLVIMVLLIFAMNFVFGKAVLFMFQK